jgi:hypothetical protein
MGQNREMGQTGGFKGEVPRTKMIAKQRWRFAGLVVLIFICAVVGSVVLGGYVNVSAGAIRKAAGLNQWNITHL